MTVLEYVGVHEGDGLTEWEALPADLFPALDAAESFVIRDPLSFPFDSLADRHWAKPMVIDFRHGIAEADIEVLFGTAALDRLTPFDQVITPSRDEAARQLAGDKAHAVAVASAAAAAVHSDFESAPSATPAGWERWFGDGDPDGPEVVFDGDDVMPSTLAGDAVIAVRVVGDGVETASHRIAQFADAGFDVIGLRSVGTPIRTTAVFSVRPKR